MVCKIQDWENSLWNHSYHLMSKSFSLTGKWPQSCEAGIKDGFEEMKILLIISDWNVPSREARLRVLSIFWLESLGISV